MAKTNISLRETERVIVDAASRIYAAYISSKRIPIGDEEQWMERAIREAIQIAKTTETVVISEGEIS